MGHDLGSSAACAVFPDQGSNSYPLSWQTDSYPLQQQGSLELLFYTEDFPKGNFSWLEGDIGLPQS